MTTKKIKRHWYNNGEKNILLAEGLPIPEGFIKGQSESFKQKNREGNLKRWQNMSSDERKELSDKVSKGTARMWSKLTTEERALREKHRQATRDSWADEYKEELSKKLSHAAILNRSQTSPEEYKRRSDKGFETRRVKQNFNTSIPETNFYNFLLEHFNSADIIREYKDPRYPFHCDFYIKSQDLFIELNLHWTHGAHPYNQADENDAFELKKLEHKANTSAFYKQFINVWTKLDVEKLSYFINNNLNYRIIYNEQELEKLKEELV